MSWPSERKKHVQQNIDSHNYRMDNLISELKTQYPQLKPTLFSEDENILERAKKEHLKLKTMPATG